MNDEQLQPFADELRAKILTAFGIDEADPDWIALDAAIGPAERDAKQLREATEQVVLAQKRRILAEASRALPPGFELRWDGAPPE